MKIYLSGPITGTAGYRERFGLLEEKLRLFFPEATFVNPVELCAQEGLDPVKNSWADFMDVCLEALNRDCTHICMMKGWRESKGAYIELIVAKNNRMRVFYQGGKSNR